MPTISFALILGDNLKLKYLKLKQCETIIDITGPTDSNTLQLMRQDPAVNSCFMDRRANLNKLIVDTENKLATLAKAGKPKSEAETIRGTFNTEYKRQIDVFEKTLDEKVKGFCKANEAKLAAQQISNWKFGIRTVWSLGELLWSAGGAVAGGVAAVPTGGVS